MTDRITVAYDPDKTEFGVKLKDAEGTVHFGPGDMYGRVHAGDTLDVTRTLRPENPKFPGDSYKISKWQLRGSDAPPLRDGKAQQELPIHPRPPSYRPQTHPVDQKQMWVNGLGQQWMTAYAQSLSVTTDGTMKKVDANVVEQAMRAIMTVGDRMFGPTMTTRPKPPPEEDNMNDQIPEQW